MRPPTLTDPPVALCDIHLQKDAGNSSIHPVFTLSVDLKPDTTCQDLSRALWYRLGDVFVASDAEGDQTIDLALARDLASNDTVVGALRRMIPGEISTMITFTRSWWYQSYNFYAYVPNGSIAKQHSCQDEGSKITPNFGSSIPDRPSQSTLPPPPETFYERYIPHLDSYFCLSIFGNQESDIDLLHTWLNDPRVDQFWRDSGTRDEHVEFLRSRYHDSHVLPVLGSYRCTAGDRSIYEPFAYYEVYWAAEDKIGKFYSAQPYDRGIHMLVGSSAHRGPHRVKSWLPSLAHYIFNDEPRTQRIISEPDHRNLKMIAYLETFGFKKVCEVDMGHKTAALMILDRDIFWAKCPL